MQICPQYNANKKIIFFFQIYLKEIENHFKTKKKKNNPNKVSLLPRVIQKKEGLFSLNNSKEKQGFVTERHSKEEIESFKRKQSKDG
jgi:hypothetical protein